MKIIYKMLEERFANIFNVGPVITSVSTFDEFRFTNVNELFCKTFGHDQDHILGKTPNELKLFNDINILDLILKQIKENGILTDLELEMLTSIGESRFFLFSAKSTSIDNIFFIFSVFTDITERKINNNEFQASLVKLNISMDLAKLAPWEFDIKNKIFILSDQFFTMCATDVYKEEGYLISFENFCTRFIPANYQNFFTQEIDDSFNSNDPSYSRQFELQLLNIDKNLIDVSVRFKIIQNYTSFATRIVGVIQDITESKKNLQLIKDSESFKNSLFNNLSVGVIVINKNDHAIELVNPIVEKMYGLNTDQLIGKKCYETISSCKEGSCPVCDLGKSIENSEQILLSADGTKIPILKSVKIITIGGKEKLLESLIDITYRKKIEKQLKRSNEQLEQTLSSVQQLAFKAEAANIAKGEFLANISHEFRTPLNGIIGITDILLSTELDEQQKKYLSISKHCSELLLALINDILDISKIEARKLELENIIFSPIDLINTTNELFKVKAKDKNITFSIMGQNNLPQSLKGDRKKLQQILNNLISNAFKFTEKGYIVLSIQNISESDSKTDNKITLRFEIKDTGIGISKTTQEKLFTPFTQADGSTSRKYGGTGLGLSISKKLVHLMSGNIGLESCEEKGSTFWFTAVFEKSLNLNDDTNTDKQLISSANFDIKNINISNLKIVVADDSFINQLVIGELFKKNNFKTDIVSNGKELLKIMQVNSYDLLFIDCYMPEIDGFEATRRIRNGEARDIHKNIPIIAITAATSPADKKKCLAAGMNDILAKPFELTILNDLLTKWAASISYENNKISNILDYASVEARLGHNKQLIKKLFSIFLQDISESQNNVGKFYKEKNFEQLSFWVHKIKGSAANVGGKFVEISAAKLEHSINSNDLSSLDLLYNEFNNSISELALLIKKELNK
ncbi:MAG: PAS domain S-box protein [Oligoflexia bacterium]|nr:PAS domain S-box protein [Oligoflexia bacterium]